MAPDMLVASAVHPLTRKGIRYLKKAGRAKPNGVTPWLEAGKSHFFAVRSFMKERLKCKPDKTSENLEEIFGAQSEHQKRPWVVSSLHIPLLPAIHSHSPIKRALRQLQIHSEPNAQSADLLRNIALKSALLFAFPLSSPPCSSPFSTASLPSPSFVAL